MNIIKLDPFGTVLTGREFGQDVFRELQTKIKYPCVLDFMHIGALGSSFGEELLIPIAGKQQGILNIKNANPIVMMCLKDIAEEFELKIVVAS